MRKFIVVIIVLTMLFTGCGSKFEPVVNQKVKVLELGEEADPTTFLEDVEDVGLTFEVVSGEIDYNTPGDYTLTYKISKGRKNVEQDYLIQVKDNDAPEITVNDTIDILYGGTFILKDYATANDERDGDVSDSLHFTGSVNAYKVGSYTITVTAEDQFGNVASKDVTVNVKEDSKEGYKKTICGSYSDASYTDGQAPTITLNEDGTFELYLNSCSVVNLVEGQYKQYVDVIYLVSEDYQFGDTEESNVARFIVQIDGTLMFDSELDLCAPNYGDIFQKAETETAAKE